MPKGIGKCMMKNMMKNMSPIKLKMAKMAGDGKFKQNKSIANKTPYGVKLTLNSR